MVRKNIFRNLLPSARAHHGALGEHYPYISCVDPLSFFEEDWNQKDKAAGQFQVSSVSSVITSLISVGLIEVERGLTRFDGGSELGILEEEENRGVELTVAQQEFLKDEAASAWKRPKLEVRGACGIELPSETAPQPPRVSIYGRRLDEFAASQCPSYRRHGVLSCVESPQEQDMQMSSAVWQRLLSEDVLQLAREILVHVCGPSCFKYSGNKVQHICRHGFYYIVSLADYRVRRRGKALRNALLVIKQTKFGMEGRVMSFQEQGV